MSKIRQEALEDPRHNKAISFGFLSECRNESNEDLVHHLVHCLVRTCFFLVAVTAAFLRGTVEEPRNALLLQSRDSQQYDPRNAIHSVCRAL